MLQDAGTRKQMNLPSREDRDTTSGPAEDGSDGPSKAYLGLRSGDKFLAQGETWPTAPVFSDGNGPLRPDDRHRCCVRDSQCHPSQAAQLRR
jgi:hypothetical protein